ncbi:MAG: glycosyltransferase family 39 protein [Anaerolineae bacterium]|nr:glycosyltransferase family 39 protein [Anaerolineae bacterium]
MKTTFWKKILDTLNPHLNTAAHIMLMIYLCVGVLIFATHGVIALGHRYPLDYGEAPLLDQAQRLASRQNIYRNNLDTPPYTVSNYPPVYIAALAPVAALFGPTFFLGRLLVLGSALATALFLGLIVQELTQQRKAAIITGLLFLTIPYVVEWSGFLRVDMMALALSTAALWVVSAYPAAADKRRQTIIAAILLVAAVYTKQSYGLAAPLAACLHLWFQDRKAALRLVAMVGGLGLALLVVLNIASGGGFFFNIVTANANQFEMGTLLRYWREVRATVPLLLILGSAFLFLTPTGKTPAPNGVPRLPGWTLAAPYLVGGVLSAATIGKIGSNVNYLLELSAALVLIAGVLWGWSAGVAKSHMGKEELRPAWTIWQPAAHNLLTVLLALQVAFLLRNTLQGPVEALKWRVKSIENLKSLDQRVETTGGPILADEYMGILTLNRKALYLQPFEMTQLALAGQWDQTPLLESIRNREFSIIMVHHFMGWPVYQSRWTPEMLTAIMTYYTPESLTADSLIYVPNDVAHDPTNLVPCPDALWTLPTRHELGMWWYSKQLLLMGAGYENTMPVYAVDEGLLMRRADWNDAVAILHDDPLHPGAKIWTFYGDMANQQGDSFVGDEFPLGSEAVPVHRGELLGYQGSAWDGSPVWVHARFAILPTLPDGGFPAGLIGRARPDDPPLPQEIKDQQLLDPSPYLGTVRSQVMGEPVWLPAQCETADNRQ